MKLIHCSDLHLDSKMNTNLSPAQAKERNDEIRVSFARLVAYAKEAGVAAVLIAGDLFDTEQVTSVTTDYLLTVMRQAQDVDFLYLKGNHDENMRPFEGRVLPKNLKTFSSEKWTTYPYGLAAVTGIELSKDNAFDLYDTLFLDRSKTNIVMLHGEISEKPGENLISLPDLKDKGINYLALGHWHTFHCEKLENDCDWCYSGVLEGRGFDELGKKGFILLEVEDHQVCHEFIPFASRTFFNLPVDITGLATVDEQKKAMEAALSRISPKDLVEFTLQGSYTPDTQKDFGFLLKQLENRFYFAKIKDESRLLIEKASYEHDISLKGEFIRTVLGSDLLLEDKDQIIGMGLAALRGEEIKENEAS